MKLAGVRRQVEEAKEALVSSAAHAARGELDPAYRAALLSRNRLFHAARGLAAAHGEPLPEMPVVAGVPGSHADHLPALELLDRALGQEDDRLMQQPLAEAAPSYGRYLGWLKQELGKTFAH